MPATPQDLIDAFNIICAVRDEQTCPDALDGELAEAVVSNLTGLMVCLGVPIPSPAADPSPVREASAELTAAIDAAEVVR